MDNKVFVLWGSHACGKTTFIKKFLAAHSNYKIDLVRDGSSKGFGGKKDWKVNRLNMYLDEIKKRKNYRIIFEGMKTPISLIEPLLKRSNEYDLYIVVIALSPERMAKNIKQRRLNNMINEPDKYCNTIEQSDIWDKNISSIRLDAGQRQMRHVAKMIRLHLTPENADNVDFDIFRLSDDVKDFGCYYKKLWGKLESFFSL